MSIAHNIDGVLADDEKFPTELDKQRARADYLSAVLAAVLHAYKPQGGATMVDVVKAARYATVSIDAVDSSTALIVWGDSESDEDRT